MGVYLGPPPEAQMGTSLSTPTPGNEGYARLGDPRVGDHGHPEMDQIWVQIWPF